VKHGSHLLGGEPASPPQVIHQALDMVSCSHTPYFDGGERHIRSGAKRASIEGPGDLGIGLLCSQCTDQFHDAGGCPPQICCIQRQRSLHLRCGTALPVQRQRSLHLRCGTALPADLDSDHLFAQQCNILDKQPEHSLAFSRWGARIVPHPR